MEMDFYVCKKPSPVIAGYFDDFIRSRAFFCQPCTQSVDIRAGNFINIVDNRASLVVVITDIDAG
ncbi:sulfate adenylyltransferase [Yersinia enterocolitica]|nr:sulfate adenylyltransferase [Yersinia enterocolitica]